MGHIKLAAPVSHIWYFKGIPSRMGLILDISPRSLEKVLYFANYIVLDAGDTPLVKKQLLSEGEYIEARDKYGSGFKVGMGATAIKALLEEIDLSALTAELRAELKEVSGQRKIRDFYENIVKKEYQLIYSYKDIYVWARNNDNAKTKYLF